MRSTSPLPRRPLLPPLRPLAVAFATGAAVMAFELLTPRLVARHLGTSVAVWSAVFAVFLGGLALGNRAGGALADRFEPHRVASGLLLASAGALLLVPTLDEWAARGFAGVPLVPRAIACVAVACLPATIVLGSVPPALAKWALASSAPPGRALGAVSAAGASGSVVATFATGFLLIPEMRTSVAIRAVAAATAAAAALAIVGTRAAAAAGGALSSAGAGLAPRRRDLEPMPRAAIAWTAAFAGASLLVLEVLAGRVAAAYVGSGLFTWTSVIGVVLLGLCVGNVIGGRMADRMPTRDALRRLLLVASVLVAATLWTPTVLAPGGALATVGMPFRIAFGAAIAWGPAAAALGAIPTVLARAAVRGDGRDGAAVGRVYAFGTAGAIAGGIVTSPVLLPALGASVTTCATAAALAAAAAVGAGRRPALASVAALIALFALAASAALPIAPARAVGSALGLREDVDGAFVRDSAYVRIRVDATIPSGVDVTNRRARRLRLDARVHGYVDLDDPTWTSIGYDGIYAAVTDRVAANDRPIRALVLGGGPYGFPRWLRAAREDAAIDVAEIDPAVTATAKEALALPRAGTLRIVDEDARTFVRDLPADAPTYDFVYGDAFDDLSVPFHLTTVEFARALKARMRGDGVYLVNAIDTFASGRFVGALHATLARVFAHVAITSLDRRRDAPENYVLVASDRDLDLDGLTRADPASRDPARRVPIVRYGPADTDAFDGKGGGIVLTDDFAPVENLLAPLLR